ncbi:UNVERIFIED_ORG: hypothetical protein J2W19_004668 [Shinella zoogloeoides]|nr:hypothetical protein [Shinella zoogloeoides]
MRGLITGICVLLVTALCCSKSAQSDEPDDSGQPSPSTFEVPVASALTEKSLGLEITYKVEALDSAAAAIVDVYMLASPDVKSSDSTDPGGEARVLITKVVPFDPAATDGTRTVTVQLPEEAREILAQRPQSVEIHLEIDQSQKETAPNAEVQLNDVKVINSP